MHKTVVAAGVGLLWLGTGPGAMAQTSLGTAFTYQGRLTDGGSPASGTYDFQFILYDATVGGSQQGPTVARDDVAVTNGLFTVSLDFGSAFTGSKRWLEVGVRPGASTGGYSPLGPRQELTAAPNAIFSAAAPWTGISGKPAGFADDVDNDTTYTAGAGLGLAGTAFSLADAGVTTAKLANAAVTTAKLATGAATSAIIADGTIALADLGQNGCSASQVMKWNGSAWACAADADTGTTYTAGTGLSLAGTTFSLADAGVTTAKLGNAAVTAAKLGQNGCTGNQVMKWNGTAWACAADADSGGDITEVLPGVGLYGGGGSGSVTLNMSLGGSGTSTAAARADHNHMGENWTGEFGVQVTATAAIPSFFIDAIWGQVNTPYQGRGVVGYATAATGSTSGVWGQSDSVSGRGVFGYAGSGTGFNFGVFGQTNSPEGYAGYFQGRVGTDKSIDFGNQTRQMLNLWGSAGEYGIGIQSATEYFRSASGFAWFRAGSHADGANDPGAGGTRNMRLDANGNLFVRGTVTPGGADFAEMLPAEDGLAAGDVLAIGPDGTLVKSHEPYQMAVAGVYSTQPGLLGGAADGEDRTVKVPLAVVGIVPVKATAENGPIRPGDRLVASAIPGHAMRASAEPPVGTVIGKALSPLGAGTGLVRMLVIMQ